MCKAPDANLQDQQARTQGPTTGQGGVGKISWADAVAAAPQDQVGVEHLLQVGM